MAESEQHTSGFPRTDGGSVVNSVTGSVTGSLIQAGDVHGGIDLRGDGPAVIQAGRAERAVRATGAVPVPVGLVEQLLAYLERIAGSDLGSLSTNAGDLHQALARTRER